MTDLEKARKQQLTVNIPDEISVGELASRMKKSKTIVLFVLSFVCAMGMGYMSSQDSSQAWVNWVEQSINTVSQLCLMLGVIVLHKAGLAEFDWRK